MSIDTERKNHKVLFLDAYFHPEQIAFSHLEKDLLECLVENGNEVYVICPTPTRGIDQEIYERYKKLFHEDMYNNRVHVERFWAPREGKNTLQRAFRYIWCNIRTLFIARKYKFIDAIFAASTPPTQGMMAALVKKKLGVPFVYNLQDVFPDSLVTAGICKEKSILMKIGRLVEKYTYRHADAIITISEDMQRNVIAKGVDPQKVVLVRNWIDTDEVKHVEREANGLFDEFKIPRDKFIVVYAGSLGKVQGMEVLTSAAEILRNNTNIHFVIFGDGAEKEKIKAYIAENNLTNVYLFPLQSVERVSEVYSMGDVAVVSCKPGTGKSGMPSKVWSIMATGTPILGSFDLDSELDCIIQDNNCGYCVEPGNSEKLAGTIELMASKKQKIEEMGINARKYAVANVGKQFAMKKYLKVFNDAVCR